MREEAAGAAEEAADLVYHVLVALRARRVPFEDVLAALRERRVRT